MCAPMKPEAPVTTTTETSVIGLYDSGDSARLNAPAADRERRARDRRGGQQQRLIRDSVQVCRCAEAGATRAGDDSLYRWQQVCHAISPTSLAL